MPDAPALVFSPRLSSPITTPGATGASSPCGCGAAPLLPLLPLVEAWPAWTSSAATVAASTWRLLMDYMHDRVLVGGIQFVA